ncbi:hypothetical protein GGTG_00986 [Gaeumannomyces tritici R3-111a-1]|uniref:Uncharacterized protein n=1 Tax=Gaeumannomyces tritici (strain R3-111a-1) TaxID=644352 RepID=J3NIA3_GAET3|nr:hypothetical protein GGTG_00986 [Gaeumannomyces tritici R3-111a-1]EJT80996.1 hypothetical protein GGTG_00986 [Gaeumannomyces tritici R3-111a-1]
MPVPAVFIVCKRKRTASNNNRSNSNVWLGIKSKVISQSHDFLSHFKSIFA